MIILALDSTAKAAAVALLCDGSVIAKDMHDDGNTHSSTLLPMVEGVLCESGLTVDDIDIFAASAGPGSFTGVRIGAATLKGLAFGKGKPCVAVSALEALAYNVREDDGIICSLMDARRGQFYTAIFESRGGKILRIAPDEAKSGEEIAASLEKYARVTLVGDGAVAAKEFFGENAMLAEEGKLLADGESVGVLAYKLYLDGDYADDFEFAPTYLRLPQAERERLESEKAKILENEDLKK